MTIAGPRQPVSSMVGRFSFGSGCIAWADNVSAVKGMAASASIGTRILRSFCMCSFSLILLRNILSSLFGWRNQRTKYQSVGSPGQRGHAGHDSWESSHLPTELSIFDWTHQLAWLV